MSNLNQYPSDQSDYLPPNTQSPTYGPGGTWMPPQGDVSLAEWNMMQARQKNYTLQAILVLLGYFIVGSFTVIAWPFAIILNVILLDDARKQQRIAQMPLRGVRAMTLMLYLFSALYGLILLVIFSTLVLGSLV